MISTHVQLKRTLAAVFLAKHRKGPEIDNPQADDYL